jgi:hypothetical protein
MEQLQAAAVVDMVHQPLLVMVVLAYLAAVVVAITKQAELDKQVMVVQG